MATNAVASSPAMRNRRGPVSSPAVVLFALFTASGLVLSSLPPKPVAAEVRGHHARHKRTVSDLVEGLMNAMYFHIDPMPPSTVITRITHVPATKVYKYVPVQKLKFSKVRARHLGEPKLRIKYPKKFSIQTEDSSLTLVKNDLPWTLHPLPPPLPTSKTIKLEVDKSMPWALHPLPPPVKTKNYSDYYWPDSKTLPKYIHRFKTPKPRQNHFIHGNYKPVNSKPTNDFKPSNYIPNDYKAVPDHKPENYNDVEYKPADDHKPEHYNDVEYKPGDDYKSENYKDVEFKPVNYKHVEYTPVDYKQIEYKHVDYKHVDYKSPDYKAEYPKHNDEGHEDDDSQNVFNHSYSHDDHSAQINDLPSPSSQSTPTEYVSHITIEPSIQIAAFSETEMQGDGTNRNTVSQGDTKQKCQCTINGHRHKRHVDMWMTNNTAITNTTTNTAIKMKDSDVGESSRNSFVAPKVGHASDVQILKSHDITDQSMINNPVSYVQQVRNMNTETRNVPEINRAEGKKNEANFRDESDKFKVDFGRQPNTRDESKPVVVNKGRLSSLKSNDDKDNGNAGDVASFDTIGGGSVGDGKHGGFNMDDYRSRLIRKPSQGRGYHIIKSKVENKEGGVAFSVQTPFSVSSYSSTVRHPMTDERQSQFRFTDQTTSSPLSSSYQSEYSEPLDFEQFGLKSVFTDDSPSDSGRLTTHFSRGFGDKPFEKNGQLTPHFSGGFGSDRPSDFSGQLSSQFSRGFGDDNRSSLKSSKPFRYSGKHGSSTSDLFNSRSKFGRPSTEESVLEYFQPIVIDFDNMSKDDRNVKLIGNSNGGSDKSRYFGKSESTGFSKFKKNQSFDQLRLPGRLHESNENLSRKMVFHPSTFDID